MSYSYNNIKLNDFIRNAQTTVSQVYQNISINQSTYTTTITGINDKPIITDYEYTGTDILNYSVAYYVDTTLNGTSFSGIPSWANKIRAVLIGGGGGGSGGHGAYQIPHDTPAVQQDVNAAGQGQYDHIVNSNHHGYNYFQFQVSHNHIARMQNPVTVNSSGGSGGGGGAFVYLSACDVTGTTGINANNGAGGTAGAGAGYGGNSAANSGGQTTLSYVKSAQTRTLYAGGGAGAITQGSGNLSTTQQTTPGGGGGFTSQGTGMTFTGYNGIAGGSGGDGFAGSGGNNGVFNSGGVYSTTTTQGSGGAGGSSGNNSGIDGVNGFYRIYFLTT